MNGTEERKFIGMLGLGYCDQQLKPKLVEGLGENFIVNMSCGDYHMMA